MPRSSAHILTAAFVLAGCNSGPPRVRPGIPRHFKIAAPPYHIGDDFIQPGLEIMFSPPYGFRAFFRPHGVSSGPPHSKGTPYVFITVGVGYPLDMLNDPCRTSPDDHRHREMRRTQLAGGVGALCDDGDDARRVIQLRKSVNWAVGCEMRLQWNDEAVISAEDASALCDTLQIIGVSDYTEADEKLALTNYGDGPSAADDP